LQLALTFFCGISSAPLLAETPSAVETARELDRIIVSTLLENGIQPAARTSDEDFLRRVSLDLAGVVPAPEQVTLFGLDPDPEKRSKLIDRLLESDRYAQIWASYWKDVIFLRATEMRSRLSHQAFETWMREQLAENRSWDQICTDLLTATGKVQEDGQVGLIFAHSADPQELAAEIGRIFLGIQLSCANCHDHPTDQWKREQFHQLAAFLPRVAVRREDPDSPNSFVVVSANQFPRAGAPFDPVALLRTMDRNRDGKLSRNELQGPLAQRFDQLLAQADKNKDGLLDAEELASIRPPMPPQGRGSSEYFMPDLNDPASRGTLMQPVFFLSEVPGPSLPAGADDLTRRRALAAYVTTPENPWFAKAFVNRIWAELNGAGFTMPIDDMGPEREAQHPAALELLANSFVASGYDIRWLFRTIALTETYQRQLRSPDTTQEDPLRFAAAVPTRLRADQVYVALQDILGLPAGGFSGRGPAGPGGAAPRIGGDPTRNMLAELFGYDPSTPQADLLGNVSQALFLMNSPQLAAAVTARPGSRLGNILRNYPDDADALSEIYLRVLCREPAEREVELFSEYRKSSSSREEAYEDLLWSLLNSTEFLTKR
jgi:hypothetical protein